MKSIFFAIGALSAAVIAAGGALAQSAEYSAESIIKHFEQSGGAEANDCAASGGCLSKSGTRGLSIGAAPTQPAPTYAPPPSASSEPPMGSVAPATGEPPMGSVAPASSEPPMGTVAPSTVTAAAEPRMGEIAPASQPAPQPAASGFNLLITFEMGSDQLTHQAQVNLDEFASAISDPRLASAVFAINGHTDATGEEAFNMALSERRAESVVSYLTAKGIAPNRLIPRGFGEEQPRTADPYDGANRRVEASMISQ